MDFEDAAVRLARDQSKMRGRRANGRGIAISARARSQAEHQKKRQAFLRAEKQRKKNDEAHRSKCLHDSQRSWNEKSLAASPSSSSQSNRLVLAPTSIHGDGDKIALPPSVLHTLTSQDFSPNDAGNPWIFRIGIRNPDYEFPASPLFRVLQAPTNNNDDDDDDDDDMSDHDDDDPRKARYLDELGHQYLAYTHCTVVEFTQEEGHVGIPRHIAEALLDRNNRHASNKDGASIPTTRTVDPASPGLTKDDTDNNESAMEIATEQTPGHLAWGAFDIPNTPLEITAVKLPKGSGCTLVPTEEAVRNNFYGLRDVKLVLEQSLVRTRATLSKGDTMSTWHRGKKYDLRVTKVLPSSFRAITCINTDIEVELGEEAASASRDTAAAATATATTSGTTSNNDNTAGTESSSSPLPTPPTGSSSSSSGFRLGGGGGGSRSPPRDSARKAETPSFSLLPEPPADQTTGVCTVQIKHSGGRGKRRFDTDKAKAKDLFAFAKSLTHHEHERAFRLVTRFPRKELFLADDDHPMDGGGSDTPQQAKLRAQSTLSEAGLRQGQELFIVEDL